MKLHVTVVHTAQPGAAPREFEFSAGPVAVGRSATGQIVIEGASISRVHLSFDTVHGAWHVTHEGSASPTFLNGSQIPKGRPTRIEDGDRIVVGNHEIVCGFPEAGMSIPGIEPLRDSFIAGLDAAEDAAVAPAERAPAFQFAPAAPPPFAAAPAQARPGPAGRVVPTLAAIRGAPETARLELSDPARNYVIGRAATCDLTLTDTSISRQHAFARFDGTRVYVRDAQSRSPVRVNGRPIVGETPLSHGDVVSVGPVDLRFVSEPEPVAAPEPEPEPEDDARATFMPRDERTQLVARTPEPPRAHEPAAPAVPWMPADPGPAPAPWQAAAPEPVAPPATPAAPAPWDHAAQAAAPAASWESAAIPAAPPPRREPPPAAPAPVPAPPAPQDWAAMSKQAAAPPRPVAPPAWETPRVAPAPAAPAPVDWNVPSIPDPGGAVPWAGPEAVPVPELPQVNVPFSPVPDVLGSVPLPSPPQIAIPAAPPPAPPPAAGAPRAPGGAEPRVVARRASSYRGWLVAGVICMLTAVVTGTIFIVAKM